MKNDNETKHWERTLDSLAQKWPSTIVGRSAVGELTGGLYTPRHLANEDSRGTGPRNAFSVNGRKVYPVVKIP